MRPIYEALGMTVGVIEAQMEPEARKAAYACDITYGTNSEFGFDYLRDNLAVELEDRVQRPHAFAIVDEVDSILVDEARTPLIIAGPARGVLGHLLHVRAASSRASSSARTTRSTRSARPQLPPSRA